MKEAEAKPLLVNNLQEQLRLDPNAVWLCHQYEEKNSIAYERFIETDVVGEILGGNEARDKSNKYVPIELVGKLNLIVLNDTMETTYAKILKDGMPWLWGKGEFSKTMMVEHLRGIVERTIERHRSDDFPDQTSAELRLLDTLLKMGELRRSDYAGGKYKKYISEVKAHDKDEDEMPFLLQAAAMFNPFIRIASDVFTTAQTKQANEQLSREYLEINRRAHHWISGIKEHYRKY